MQYSTIPFTLVDHDQAFLLDVDALYAHATALTDGRKPRGVRYPLPLLITVAVLAKLAGFVHMEDVADWAKLRRFDLQHFFGTKRVSMPHHTTWSRVLGSAVDVQELNQLVQRLLAPLPVGEVPDRCSIQVALDGKTLRGTIPRGSTRGVHLLAAYLPSEGVVLFQVAVERKENEIVAAPMLLKRLDLTGTVVSGDAMFTQRQLSIQIVEAGGDYLWMVKDNQPSLRADIELLFEEECVSAGWSAPPVDFTTARSLTKGHGRIEERILTTSSMLAEYSDWPYLAQVFKLEYRTWCCITGKATVDIRYGVTSAPVTVLDAEGLLGATRRQWGMETGLHGRRDVCFREDAMRTRTGQAPQVLATLNNLVLSLLGRLGITNVAEAQRALDYHIDRALYRQIASTAGQATT
jgi:predicted transposase YbfD/YdcC